MTRCSIACVAGFVCLALVHLPSPSLCQECTEAAINNCTAPLAAFGLKGLAVFPPLEYTQVNDLCRQVPDVTSCLFEFKSSCDVYLSRFIDGLSAAYDYICGDDYIIYYENRDCFARPDIVTMSNKCNASYQENIHDSIRKAHYTSNDGLAKDACKNIRGYVFCLQDGLESLCGKDAANWQHEVNVRGLSPMIATLGPGECNFDKARFTDAEIAGIVIGSILGFALLCYLVYLLTCNLYRYRKKHRKLVVQTEQET